MCIYVCVQLYIRTPKGMNTIRTARFILIVFTLLTAGFVKSRKVGQGLSMSS